MGLFDDDVAHDLRTDAEYLAGRLEAQIELLSIPLFSSPTPQLSSAEVRMPEGVVTSVNEYGSVTVSGQLGGYFVAPSYKAQVAPEFAPGAPLVPLPGALRSVCQVTYGPPPFQ
jgi:hypothetical protein